MLFLAARIFDIYVSGGNVKNLNEIQPTVCASIYLASQLFTNSLPLEQVVYLSDGACPFDVIVNISQKIKKTINNLNNRNCIPTRLDFFNLYSKSLYIPPYMRKYGTIILIGSLLHYESNKLPSSLVAAAVLENTLSTFSTEKIYNKYLEGLNYPSDIVKQISELVPKWTLNLTKELDVPFSNFNNIVDHLKNNISILADLESSPLSASLPGTIMWKENVKELQEMLENFELDLMSSSSDQG